MSELTRAELDQIDSVTPTTDGRMKRLVAYARQADEALRAIGNSDNCGPLNADNYSSCLTKKCCMCCDETAELARAGCLTESASS